jgi:hypothetical protein
VAGLTPKENYLLVMNHQVPERIPNSRLDVSDYIPLEIAERAPGDGSFEQRFGGTGLDWFGVHWVFQASAGASMVDPEYPHMLEDVTRWKAEVKFPDLEAFDWAAMAKRDASRFDPNKLGCITILNGMFERLHSLMGMAEACCALLMEPTAVFDFFGAITEHKLKLMEKIIAHYPIQMIEYHDDWGHANDSFFSRETWSSLIEPHMKRIIAFAREKGIHLRLHCCGKADRLVDLMVAAGIEHWSSVQTINDVRNILKKYGHRLSLTGGMDLDVLKAPGIGREEMKRIATKQVIDFCKGGALVPFAAATVPGLVEVLNEVLEDQKDYFKNPENRLLENIP